MTTPTPTPADTATSRLLALIRAYKDDPATVRGWCGNVGIPWLDDVLAERDALKSAIEAFIRTVYADPDGAIEWDTIGDWLADFSGHVEKWRDASAEVASLKAAILDAYQSWSFSDSQQHTHTWHTKADWVARHVSVIAALLANPEAT